MAPPTLQPGPTFLVKSPLENALDLQVMAVERDDPEEQQHAHERLLPDLDIRQVLALRRARNGHANPGHQLGVHALHRRSVRPHLVGIGAQERVDLHRELAHVRDYR